MSWTRYLDLLHHGRTGYDLKAAFPGIWCGDIHSWFPLGLVTLDEQIKSGVLWNIELEREKSTSSLRLSNRMETTVRPRTESLEYLLGCGQLKVSGSGRGVACR